MMRRRMCTAERFARWFGPAALVIITIVVIVTTSADAVAQQPATDTAETLKATVLAPTGVDDITRYEALQKLMRLAINDVEARKIVARDVISPAVPFDLRENLLGLVGRLVTKPDMRDAFLPDYIGSLLLVREARSASGLKPLPQPILASYAPAVLISTLEELVRPAAPDTEPDDRRARVQLAAVRAMADPSLQPLTTRIGRFAPTLIDVLAALTAEGRTREADTVNEVVASLQAITEKRTGIDPVDSAPAWNQWWNSAMRDKTELERVLAVYENLRQNREALREELRKVRLAEELRAIDAAKENVDSLTNYVEPARDRAVLVRALQYLAALLAEQPLAGPQRDRLIQQMRDCYLVLSDQDDVVNQLTETALAIPVAGEELVLAQMDRIRAPGIKATVMLKLARAGRQPESLMALLGVLREFRDGNRVDLRVVRAALTGVSEWREYSPESAAAVVEAMVELVKGLPALAEEGAKIVVDLHNAVNNLSDRVDTTPVVQQVLATDRAVISLQLQLVTVREALAGPAREPLSAWLREHEHKQHMLRGLLKQRESLRYELLITLDILAAIDDPFTDPADPEMYFEIASLAHNPGPGNGDVRQRVAQCLAAFAAAEIARLGPDEVPAYRVFDMLMANDLAKMAVDTKLVDKLPEAHRTDPRWKSRVDLLRARLRIRTPDFARGLDDLSALAKAEEIPQEIQLADIRWALGVGGDTSRAGQAELRLAVLPRLVTALHPHGAENVPGHVWKAIAADGRARLSSGNMPGAASHVLRCAHALADWAPIRPVVTLEANQPVRDWRDVVTAARTGFSDWQINRWRELETTIEAGKPLPPDVRAFALDTSHRLPAVPEARFPAVSGNDAVAVPGLGQKLLGLEHGQQPARAAWLLIIEAAAANGKTVGNTWPTADRYDTVRQALLNELRNEHGYK